jgi:hypothetical protein
MKRKWFWEDVFCVSVLAITGTKAEAQKILDKYKVDFSFHGVGFCAEMPDNQGFLIWLEKPDNFYHLLHECVHLVRCSFQTKGMNTELGNEDEAFAYYLCSWFKTLWRFYGNIDKKGNKKALK